MDTKNKANEKQKCDVGGFVFPFGTSQEMSEMMKNCCTSESILSSCRSMMSRMMNSAQGSETNQGEAKETTSKDGQTT